MTMLLHMMMILAVYPLAAALVSALLSGAARHLLRRFAILDRPGARSNHTRPVPRGGGLAVILTIAGFWLAAPALLGAKLLPLPLPAILALGLAVVFFIEDMRGLSIGLRLGVQLAAVLVALPALDGPVFQGWLPDGPDRALTVLLWLWLINLFNFMDGIDGISGVETLSIGGGIGLVALLGGLPDSYIVYGAIPAAAALGFLWWNWHPARLFLGDAGSIPLGFLLGFLLLQTAALGYPLIALLLPGYYLADASLTLVRRVLRGHRPWQAHSEHAYQLAVRAGWGHRRVVLHILALNALLLAIALLLLFGFIREPGALALGAAAIAALLYRFYRAAGTNRPLPE